MPTDDKLPVKLSLPLDFQQEVFHELREEDELLIIARGLGLLRLVSNLLHSYDAAGNNLIILVGADERENAWIGESLAEHAAVSMSPKARGLGVVQTDLMTVGTREQMYSKGGIFSITSRILIVDLLVGLLDPTTITGMVVLHGDRVVATSMEAFILRIYRQKNRKGFLKAFTDNPEPLTTGFAPLMNTLRNLFLKRPSLYPRFHVSVAKSLEGKKRAEVIELEVPMTQAMKDIQTAIMECIDVSISELKKSNPSLDMEDWSTDSALHRNFEAQIRRQLDPVWHRTSFKTRQVVRDLAQLRSMLHDLLTSDAVSFLRMLDTVLASSTPPPGSSRQNQSPWLFLDAAHTIFDSARRRVYTGKIQDKDTPANKNNPNPLRPILEEQPKWDVLADTLDEIEQDNYFNPQASDHSNKTILIMAGDQRSCRQIREYLSAMYVNSEEFFEGDAEVDDEDESTLKRSAASMMRRNLRNYIVWKRDFAKVNQSLFSEHDKNSNGSTDSKSQHSSNRNGKPPPNKRRRVRGGGAAGSNMTRDSNVPGFLASDREANVASLMAELDPTEAEALHKGEVGVDNLEHLSDYYKLLDMKDLILVHPYDGDNDDRLLEEVRPRYIVMYEPDAAFIRRVEVYRSSHTDRNVRVYFMYYGGSVEEQRYLSVVRKEKDAFTKLIRERSTMTVTLTLDAHGVEDAQESFLRTVNTRIAGGGRLTATATPPRVVVDVREFRSSLPSLLHGSNVEVIPCMLTVGDYVLSPEICVERKSVSDLIASFKNGRLHHQAETMLLHYKSPMLLIEFDQNKAFTLEPFADLTMGGNSSLASLNPNSSSDLQSKLVLLTLAFPRLKIIWSSSPYQTAEIFQELKRQQDEPDPMKAVQTGLEQGEDAEQQTFSQVPQEMLRQVPGVTSKVIAALTLEVGNIVELANLSEEQLAELVGKETGRQVYRFFNRSVFDD